MKQHLACILCLVAISVFTSGCNQIQARANGSPPSPSPENYADTSSSKDVYSFAPLEEFTPSGNLDYLYVGDIVEGYANESGYYRTFPRADGSANLLYTDFDSKSEVYLCNQPNCAHDQEGCTAWFPSSIGFHRPIPIGEYLVMLHGGAMGMYELAGDDVLPHIDRMNLNGSNRKTVCTFSADCLISPLIEDSMARDDKNLYFTIEKYNEDSTTRLLCAFDVETEKLFCLKELDEVEEKIIGCDGENLVLSYVTETYTYESKATDLTCQIEVFNLNSLESVPLITQNYVDTGTCYNGIYYVLDHYGKLKSYNLQTGEQTRETALHFSDEFQLNSMYYDGTVDGVLLTHTFLYKKENDETILCYWGIDLEQGNAFEMHQTFVDPRGYNYPSCPIANYNGELLYLSGIGEETLDTPLPDGQVIETEYRFYLYSMMPLQAYLDNRNESIPISSCLS